jgi:hypothetical protein
MLMASLYGSNGFGVFGDKHPPMEMCDAVGSLEEKVVHLQGVIDAMTAVGPIGGVSPSYKKPHIIMGMDVDYPPYAYLKEAPYGSAADLDEVVGVGADMIKAMAKMCDFDVTITQAHWADCWGAGEIGQGLKEGWYHGCMTYTHAAGVRNRYLDFSNGWAIKNKPSGLITKLNNGVPVLSPMSDLSGKTIVDVTGWAPTADTLHFVNNQCTGSTMADDFTVIQGDDLYSEEEIATLGLLGPNDMALQAVLDGKADGMWVYGDQAANYHCAAGETQEGWNCDLWGGFGTTFAYSQSGMFGWMYNGTTVAISKKGSGLNELLDPCLEKFMQTKEFLETCKIEHGDPAHSQIETCVPNAYFYEDPHYHAPTPSSSPYMFGGLDYAGGIQSCSTGYCGCEE